MQHPGRWWIGLVPLLAVWIAANLIEQEPIEQDLGQRATAALAPDDEIEHAAAHIAGRDVTLTGTGASIDVGTALAAKIDALRGVRLVRTAFSAPPAMKPYAFSAIRSAIEPSPSS